MADVEPDAGAFERLVVQSARRFDLKPLLDLLAHHGYQPHEILFRSSIGGTSPSIVEEVCFVREPFRHVQLTLNIGLLGDSSLLPSYFFRSIDNAADGERLLDFIRFFDHQLLTSLVRALYPEDKGELFGDWSRAKESFLRMLGVNSPGTLRWLTQLYFPELRVNVQRLAFSQPARTHAFCIGGLLDGNTVMGPVFEASAAGFLIELFAEEELDSRGRSWARVVESRLRQGLLRRLAPFRVALVVRLHFEVHASWLHIEDASAAHGLGYDRLRTSAESGHSVVLFRGIAGEDEGV